MSKNAIFYFARHLDDYTEIQYKYLLKSGLDVYVFCNGPTVIKERFRDAVEIFNFKEEDFKYVSCPDLNSHSTHKLNVVRNEWRKDPSRFDKYEHIYLIEPKFRCSLELSDLFNTLDNNSCDLLTSYVQKLKGTNVGWGWYNVFKKLYNEDNYNMVLKSYEGGFTRVSVNALNFLATTEDPVFDYFIDLSLPTLLYNNGFTINSLSSTHEDDEEFKCFDYCNSKTYYYSVSHIPVEEYDRSKQLIYNAYQKAEELLDLIDTKIENPDITVVMPVYNEEALLERAIESVLNQEDFTNYELWCINDGSTDGTVDILNKYKDHPNVVVINRDHNGLTSTLNFGVEHANGKYIVRFDCDDVCLPNRLRHQYDYMESHPECDVLTSSALLAYKNDDLCSMGDYEITLEALEGNNRLFHPAVIMRTESIRKLPFLYEFYYDAAEDYKFWVTCAIHGLRLFADSTPVIKYSQSRTLSKPEQIQNAERIKQLCNQVINGVKKDKEHQMTAIVSFRNEYDEIEKTVAAIRSTTKNMPIILVNDASDNNYDYEFVAKKYHCKYLYNSVPSGVAGARMDAVKNVETKYFIILDGHMRMYEQDWDLRAIKIMEEYGDNHAYFGRTSIISKTGTNQSTNENGKVVNPTYGACLKGYEFTLTPGWISVPSEVNFNANDNVVPVPILLGADYMMSVEFWNKIHGLEGLLSWGQDETLLSLKTWLAGSKVYLIQDMIFGHVYRNKRPYNAIAIEMNSNYIYCNYLFAKDDKDYEELNWLYEKYLGHEWYMKAYDCFMERFEEAKAFKEYFYNEVATQTMEWFWDFNYNADPKQVQEYYDNKNQKLAERNTETNS